MKNIINSLFYSVIFIFLASCSSKKVVHGDMEINAAFNSEYAENMIAYEGQLSKNEFRSLKKKFEKELNVEIPNGKTIHIHYSQKAPNCHLMQMDKENFEDVIGNIIRITNNFTSHNDAVNLLIYHKDMFYNDIFERKAEYYLDTGFFYDNVFTDHKVCQAFMIIKPNGKFYKRHGEHLEGIAIRIIEMKED
ncbi:hypothetical protein [Psychroflexus halocasei]|uniref:Lipoprotein n=1 Tax=Psychroflexus halocasei TaxID=908615 RepID=A0A1H3YB14_9FLAO|nr:hypothetical protein [Psychroflexus halocasei]SEA08221.1 hypothetical protein SAMN05421540_10374 [Psychroflexus halocasei]